MDITGSTYMSVPEIVSVTVNSADASPIETVSVSCLPVIGPVSSTSVVFGSS